MTQGLLADAVTLRATGIDTNIFQENTKYANVNISGRRSHYILTPPKNPQKSGLLPAFLHQEGQGHGQAVVFSVGVYQGRVDWVKTFFNQKLIRLTHLLNLAALLATPPFAHSEGAGGGKLFQDHFNNGILGKLSYKKNDEKRGHCPLWTTPP